MILLTRSLAHSKNLAVILASRGLQTAIEPLVEIVAMTLPTPEREGLGGSETLGHRQPLPNPPLYEGWEFRSYLEQAHAIAFSSAIAPRLMATAVPQSLSLPAYVVGTQTAKAAIAHGWDVKKVADTGKALMPFLPPHTVHARGRHVAIHLGDLPPLILYEARMPNALSPHCQDLLRTDTLTHVLFFSARVGACFVRLVEKEGLLPHLSLMQALCLSPRVVESVRGASWRACLAPVRPNTDLLLALLET